MQLISLLEENKTTINGKTCAQLAMKACAQRQLFSPSPTPKWPPLFAATSPSLSSEAINRPTLGCVMEVCVLEIMILITFGKNNKDMQIYIALYTCTESLSQHIFCSCSFSCLFQKKHYHQHTIQHRIRALPLCFNYSFRPIFKLTQNRSFIAYYTIYTSAF